MRRQLDLGDGGVRQSAAVSHGVEHRGHAHAPFFEGARGFDPPVFPAPDGMFGNRLQTGGNARGMGQGYAGGICIAALHGIFQPQRQRIHVQAGGQPVHHAFEGKACLCHAEGAHGPRYGVVRIDAPAFHMAVRNAVRAAGMLHAKGHDLASQVGVCAGVVIHAALQGVQRSVGLGAQPVVHARRVALVAREHAFFAAPPHLDASSAGVQGRQRQQALHG